MVVNEFRVGQLTTREGSVVVLILPTSPPLPPSPPGRTGLFTFVYLSIMYRTCTAPFYLLLAIFVFLIKSQSKKKT